MEGGGGRPRHITIPIVIAIDEHETSTNDKKRYTDRHRMAAVNPFAVADVMDELKKAGRGPRVR
jgi:hypothetical protein